MLRRPNISPSKRREWLRRIDDGESEQKISSETGYTRRAVHDAVQRARMAIDFEAAQREQLREALQSHQHDLLSLIARIGRILHVPPLELISQYGLDFGLEDLHTQVRNSRELDIPLIYADPPDDSVLTSQLLASARRSETGIEGIEICEEDSILWKALKQHIGSKDPLWRAVGDWKQATLVEFQARRSLNGLIREVAEKTLELKLTGHGSEQKQINPNLISRVRIAVTAESLGLAQQHLIQDLTWNGSTLMYRSTEGLLRIENPSDQVLERLAKVIDSVKSSDALTAARDAYRSLERVVGRGSDHAQEYLLLHHVPGRCSICRKLGGQ